MADGASVPLWFSALTFFGGVASGQLTELIRAKREQRVAIINRRNSFSDRRIQFQRETLIEMQESSAAACERFVYLVKVRGMPGNANPEYAAVSQQQQTFVLRWMVLKSRLEDRNLVQAAQEFSSALAAASVANHIRPDGLISASDPVLSRLATMNILIGSALKGLNEEEQKEEAASGFFSWFRKRA